MEKLESLNVILLNKLVLTLFVIMLVLAITTVPGIFDQSALPPLPL